MSRLVLVGRGQARAFEEDSDRLSELGELQARRLGEYFAARGVTGTEVYSGTLVRQRRTAELMGTIPSADARWNEYDAGGVLSRIAPELAAQDSKFGLLAEAAKKHRHTPEANRHFQRMFEVLMNRWITGELSAPGVESWQDFQARVGQALNKVVCAEGERRNVLVVSSGGPIATAVQRALAAPSEMALELNWRMRNSSITEFLFTRGRLTLDLFNATPHLEVDQVTYR